jgi:hypothetical protein
MVAINPHGGQDISVMQSIAAATGGRYYFPQDPAQLPSIFIKEAKTLKRSMLQNRVFHAVGRISVADLERLRRVAAIARLRADHAEAALDDDPARAAG